MKSGCPESLGVVIPPRQTATSLALHSVFFPSRALVYVGVEKQPAETSIVCRLWRSVEKSTGPVNTCSWELNKLGNDAPLEVVPSL